MECGIFLDGAGGAEGAEGAERGHGYGSHLQGGYRLWVLLEVIGKP